MKNHELISEEEWYNRLVKDGRYVTITINWDRGITRVLDRFDGELYDVEAVKIEDKHGRSKLMLKVEPVPME